MKKALITGITGQDGSYLAEFLLSKGYQVHGVIRRSSTFNTQRIDHLYVDPHEADARLFLHHGDLADAGALSNLIHKIKPDEVYNLAAQSHVQVSFQMPEYTGNITGLGVTRMLEAIRDCDHHIKFYQASSSEMFGSALAPQHEKTYFQPRSPYAAAKVYGYHMTAGYRQAYGMFACNGILFNHESPRRGETFVTRKITRAIAAILAGKQKKLYLGNLDALRDWGFAPEYVEMMWIMLQHHIADDYVVGTGESHSVREFVEKAFMYAGIEIEWRGQGVNEKAVVRGVAPSIRSPSHKAPENTQGERIAGPPGEVAGGNGLPKLRPGDTIIEIDPRYFRPAEVDHLQADITKARTNLCWQPRVSFDELVKIMVDYDLLYNGIKPMGDGVRVSQTKGFGYTNHYMINPARVQHGVY